MIALVIPIAFLLCFIWVLVAGNRAIDRAPEPREYIEI